MQDQPSRATSSRASRSNDEHAYTVMNTVHALERMAVRPHSVPELAEALQISERSTRRLMRRLAVEGYVQQGGGHRRRYRATMRLAALGRELVEHAELPRLAVPALEAIAAALPCAAQLWIPAGEGAICILYVDAGLRAGATSPTLGEWRAAGEHAAGAVLAAYDHTPGVVDDVRVKRIRGRGWAASAAPDPFEVAAPVFERGVAVAAVSVVVAWPIGDRERPILHALIAASELSAALGLVVA